MINVNNEYIKASESNNRKSYIVAKYGLFNKQAKSKISQVTYSERNAVSRIIKTYDEIKETNYNYITCEPNRVKLDGTFCFVENNSGTNNNQFIAYWSYYISNENGLFANNPKIVYMFSELINFTEVTLYFQEVCSELIVRYYNNDTLLAQRNVTNNNKLTISTNGSTINGTFNKLEIEFVKTLEPYRYIKFNEIDFGAYQQFTDKQIIDFNVIDELSIDTSELTANYLSLSIDDEKGEYDILNPNNKLNMLQEQQELSLYYYLDVNGAMQELPLGTFLLKDFNVRNKTLEIQAYDDTYFMNSMYYGGRFYQDTPVKNILEDLFNYFNYTKYKIDDELDEITLTGFVPRVEFREALRLICEASGCVINKTRYGETYIFKTYDNVTKAFGQRIIFNESPSRNLFNNVIDIVEYNYEETQEEVELFNGTLDRGTHTILYSQYPIDETSLHFEQSLSNVKLVSAYATSCVIQISVRATKVVLKGTYHKANSIVKRVNKSTTSNLQDYAITKVNNYLITSSNSDEIANWKLGRKDIKYNFKTLVMPYIEVGDTCTYATRYGTINEFIPTRIEFTKSLLQTIEGE